ncbi:MAG: hypothetical protein AABY22_26480 [Nanoarchaeota archaeon]
MKNSKPITLSTMFRNKHAAKVLDLLLQGWNHDFSAREMIDNTKLAKQTLYKTIYDLKIQQLIVETRKIGRLRMYSVNKDSPKIQALIKFQEGVIGDINS